MEIKITLDMQLLDTKIKTLQKDIMDRIYYEKEKMKHEKRETKRALSKIAIIILIGFIINVFVTPKIEVTSEQAEEAMNLINAMITSGIVCVMVLISIYVIIAEYNRYNNKVKKICSLENLTSQLEKGELVDYLCRNKDAIDLIIENGSENARKIRKYIKKINKYQKLRRIILNSDTVFITIYENCSKIKIRGDKWTEHVKFKIKKENYHSCASSTHITFGLSGFCLYTTCNSDHLTKKEYKAYTKYIIENHNKKELIN